MAPGCLCACGRGWGRHSEDGDKMLPRKVCVHHSYAWAWILNQQNSQNTYMPSRKRERQQRGKFGEFSLISSWDSSLRKKETVRQLATIRSGKLPIFQKVLVTTGR